MFSLVEMKDTVRVPPWLFHVKLNEAIVDALNKKLANKVRTTTTHNAPGLSVWLCVWLCGPTR